MAFRPRTTRSSGTRAEQHSPGGGEGVSGREPPAPPVPGQNSTRLGEGEEGGGVRPRTTRSSGTRAEQHSPGGGGGGRGCQAENHPLLRYQGRTALAWGRGRGDVSGQEPPAPPVPGQNSTRLGEEEGVSGREPPAPPVPAQNSTRLGEGEGVSGREPPAPPVPAQNSTRLGEGEGEGRGGGLRGQTVLKCYVERSLQHSGSGRNYSKITLHVEENTPRLGKGPRKRPNFVTNLAPPLT